MMRLSWFRFGWIVCSLMAVAVLATPAVAQEEAGASKPLPLVEEMQLPSMADLLQKPHVDWVVLKKGEVLIVKPVHPRPKTLEVLAKQREEALKIPFPKRVKLNGETKEEFEERFEVELERFQLQRAKPRFLEVVLPDNLPLPEGVDDPVFQLEVERFVERVVHHEDHMLQRTDKLIDDGMLGEAYEMLFTLERRQPKWPGLQQRRHRLLFAEAKKKRANNDFFSAMVFLEDLSQSNPNFDGLDAELGSVFDTVITSAADKKDYRKTRHFLGRLARLKPQHEKVLSWRQTLLQESQKLKNESAAATQKNDHDLAMVLIEKAANVWPATPGLREAHRRAAMRYQKLNVGVVALPGENKGPYFLPTLGDQRQTALQRIMLFDVDRVDGSAHYSSSIFEEWEPEDLGRRTVFKLRPTRDTWESQDVITSSSIVAALTRRLNPRDPTYDERLASYVRSINVRSPFEFVVNFSRVPVRTEPLLKFAMSVREQTAVNEPPVDKELFKFRVQEQNELRITYRRSIPEPNEVDEHHIAEINEIRYEDYDRAFQGLMRGEISMLPHVPSWNLDQLAVDERFFLRYYALPLTHLIQFNPDSKLMKNSELRRSLAFALDREKILKEDVLQDPEMRRGRVISAPYPSSSDAYRVAVAPRDPDLKLGFSLAMVVKKRVGGKLPEIKMLVEPDVTTMVAAKSLVKQWATVGITVKIVEGDVARDLQGRPKQWDMIYRTMRMAEPVTEMWPFMTMARRAEVSGLSYLPDWLRQDLVELDEIADWNSAVKLLNNLHEKLKSDVQVIPLWEVDDAMVIRKNIQGYPVRPMHPYHQVQRWTITPWLPTDSI